MKILAYSGFTHNAKPKNKKLTYQEMKNKEEIFEFDWLDFGSI